MSNGQTVVFLNSQDDVVELVVYLLEDAGYKVEGFTDPIDAMLRIRAVPHPCLVILDYDLRATRGDEFVAAIHAAGVRVPIVLLTNRYICDIDATALKSLGVSDILRKPISPVALEMAITKHGRGSCERSTHGGNGRDA